MPRPDGTRRALLAAMHFPANADPADLLREMDEREWRRPLPPVMVLRAGERAGGACLAARSAGGPPHRWILTAEDGGTTTGEFVPAELPRLGDKRLGGASFLRGELGLPALADPGYYRLEVEQPGRDVQPQAAMTLIVTPAACFQPEAIKGEHRVWGPTVQLYGLRSRRNWGIGDFGDLRSLVDLTADAGGGVVGVNPLHALFPDDPGRISPYSPSSR